MNLLLICILFFVNYSGCFPHYLQHAFAAPGATNCLDAAFIGGGNLKVGLNVNFEMWNLTDFEQYQWTLSQARMALAATSVGSTVIFAGGEIHANNTWLTSDVIDTFDARSHMGNPTTIRLSQPRAGMSVSSLGNLGFFAGGYLNWDSNNSAMVWTNIVDIFNSTDNRIYTKTLSIEFNRKIAMTSLYDVALFVGGNTMNIYNATSDKWNSMEIPYYINTSSARSLGENAYFFNMDMAYVYNIVNNTWKYFSLPAPCCNNNFEIVILGDLILFGDPLANSTIIHAYNTLSESWEEFFELSAARNRYSTTTVNVADGQMALFIGGVNASFYVYNIADVFFYCALNGQYYSNISTCPPPSTTTSSLATSSSSMTSSTTGTFGTTGSPATSTSTSGAQTTGTTGSSSQGVPRLFFALLISSIFVCIGLVITTVYFIMKRRTKIADISHYSLISVPSVKYLKDIEIVEKLGSGQFSEVYRGLWKKLTPVAIKKLKPQHMAEFEHEVDIFCKLNHPNCVRLYGIYIANGEKMMVLEYFPLGDLSTLLRNQGSIFSTYDLIRISLQILSGMSYLVENHILHRDLALRNVLVAQQNGKYIAKVSDFGLARIENNGYYRTEDKTLAVRWAAIESIQYGRFTEKSDVWSLGVCLWELFSYGMTPFAGQTNVEVIKKLSEGERLSCPENCPHEIYTIMLLCWKANPSERPSFESLTNMLNSVTQLYEQDETVVTEITHIDYNNV